MVKELFGTDFNSDVLFDFMTKHLLEDPDLNRRYLAKAVRNHNRGRGLRGALATILAGAHPTTLQEYKTLTETTAGRATVVAFAPEDKKHQVASRMMKEYFFEEL